MALVDKHTVRLVKFKQTAIISKEPYSFNGSFNGTFIQSCILDPNTVDMKTNRDYTNRTNDDYKTETVEKLEAWNLNKFIFEYTYPTNQPFIQVGRTDDLSNDNGDIGCHIYAACKRTRCFLFEGGIKSSIVYQLKDNGQIVKLYELKEDNFMFVFADLGLMVIYKHLPDRTYDVAITRVVDQSLVFQCRVIMFRRVNNWLLTRQVADGTNNSKIIAYEFKLVNKEYKVEEYNLGQLLNNCPRELNIEFHDYCDRYFALCYSITDYTKHSLFDQCGIYQLKDEQYNLFKVFNYKSKNAKQVKKLYCVKIFDTIQRRFVNEYMVYGINSIELDVEIKIDDGRMSGDDYDYLTLDYLDYDRYRVDSNGDLVNKRIITTFNYGDDIALLLTPNTNFNNQISFIPSEETRDIIKNIIANYTHCCNIVMNYLF